MTGRQILTRIDKVIWFIEKTSEIKANMIRNGDNCDIYTTIIESYEAELKHLKDMFDEFIDGFPNEI